MAQHLLSLVVAVAAEAELIVNLVHVGHFHLRAAKR